MKAVHRYPLPEWEWARWAWASAEAESTWAPLLARYALALEAAERETVGSVREAAIQQVAPESLAAYTQAAAARGLAVVVLDRTASVQGYRSGSPGPPAPGQPWVYRVALAVPEAVRAITEAVQRQDDDRVGALLGYPSCCRQAFLARWVRARWRDVTWPMAAEAGRVEASGLGVWVSGPAEANVLLRWIGLRLVPHLPCHFGCEASAALGRALAERLPADLGAMAQTLLGMPMEWSAWHGLGAVRTPLGRLSMRSDATVERIQVWYEGQAWPAAGVETGAFPYVRPTGARAVAPASEHVEDVWTDSGFASLEAMQRAHAVVLAALGPGPYGSVLDLGCGNGQLLLKIPAGIRLGVEVDPGRAAAAAKHPELVVLCGDLLTLLPTLPETDLTLICPIRLLEQPAAAPVAAEALMRRRGTIVVYAYGDVLARTGGLARLTAQAGLGTLGEVVSDPGVAEAARLDRRLTP